MNQGRRIGCRTIGGNWFKLGSCRDDERDQMDLATATGNLPLLSVAVGTIPERVRFKDCAGSTACILIVAVSSGTARKLCHSAFVSKRSLQPCSSSRCGYPIGTRVLASLRLRTCRKSVVAALRQRDRPSSQCSAFYILFTYGLPARRPDLPPAGLTQSS